MPNQSKTKFFKFPEVRVVEASAGSGKTYALAKRYVQLLLNTKANLESIPIRNILAITFTNKASLEMKSRILELLKKVALKKLTTEERVNVLGPIGNSKIASRKAFTIMDSLIHNYNFFQVQTIDSFINALLSGCAFKIGLSANFTIKRNSKDYLEQSLDQLIEKAKSEKSIYKIFEQFLHQYLFIENRSGWFPKKDMLALMYGLYHQMNMYGFEFSLYDIKSEDLYFKKKNILELMKSLKPLLPEETDKRFLTSLDSFLKRHEESFDIDSLSDYFAREELPVLKGATVPEDTAKIFEELRINIKELCEVEAFTIFNCYIEVLSRLYEDFSSLVAKDDILFLEELNKKAKELFEEGNLSVPELYYRLATRFRHYLIDEFQDTSMLQWQNLHVMVEEALSTGGSLFYVGDKKQAIYGFRGGEVRLFDQVKEKFSSFNVVGEKLETNYRSQVQVIEFNNHVFSKENLQRMLNDIEMKRKDIAFGQADIEMITNVFSHSHQKFLPKNNGGCVRIEYIDIDKKQERDQFTKERLINLTNELGERVPLKDIAILTRDNKEVEQVTSWLLSEGLLVESDRTTNIKENMLIQDLVFFLKFLNSPIDNLAFGNFIIGEMFSRGSQIESKRYHDFIFSLREKVQKETSFYIYREFRSQFSEVWDALIDEFFKNVGLYPVYEFIISIIQKFQILENFPEYQGYIMRLLELIKEKEEDFSDVASFLEFFEALEGEDCFVNVSDSKAIKVMTVHKAKGLEFSVVILPFLSMDVQVATGGSDQQQSYLVDVKSDHIQLLKLKRKYCKFSNLLNELWTREYKKALLSELNNAYVALTRAKTELYAFIPKKTGNSFNYANFLVPEEVFLLGKQKNLMSKQADDSSNRLKLSSSQYCDWIEFLKDEFLPREQIFNKKVRVRGEILHYILSQLKNLYGNSFEKCIDDAMEITKLKFSVLDKEAEHKEVIKKLLNEKKLHQFFNVVQGEIFTEIELIDALGHTKRVDRLIILKDEVWIIDYKSSRDSRDLGFVQVNEYKNIVRYLHPEKEVKGFIIYLDNCLYEEVL